MAKNLALSHHEDAFFWVQAELIQLTLLKYGSKLRQVTHSLLRMNAQVINIDVQKTFEEILEYLTHESLKCRRGICQPKRHYSIGKSASFCGGKILLVLVFRDNG